MFLGLGLAFGCLSAGLWPVRILAEACAILSVVFLVGAVVALFKRDPDAYDLASLREVHERELLKQIQVDEPAEFDSVHCLTCGEIYNMRMPICPRCKSPQGNPPCF